MRDHPLSTPANINVLAVLVSTAARSGGTAAFVGESAIELERLGGTMTVLATDLALAPIGWVQRQRRIGDDERHPSLRRPSVTVCATRFPRRLAFSPALARAAREQASRYDVIHLHNLWQLPQHAGYRAARTAGVSHIVSPHGALDPYLRRRGRARKRLSMTLFQGRVLRDAALIHVTTAKEAEFVADIAPDVPRAVVPCGVYVERFRELPPPARFRHEQLNGYEGPVVLFIGRLTYKKGLDVLLRSFAKVRSVRHCRLVIAGPDDERLTRKLTQLAVELRVADDVAFVGPVYGQERLAALASADVWALPSHAENFGIAVIEAMAAGCPVAISNRVNLADDVEAAAAGLVAEPTPEHFAEAIAALLDDGPLTQRVRSAAPRLAARYDWSIVAPQLLDMYKRAAQASG